ncbi:MAG: neutral/alkaline non-lysosomal ceramidase N-terminal domain-containing protein [Armatimonadetes bacterium]|nr:neutral/alkaline non-lysosomal ceramidase N-terminal domain-containing protein [Armatimonadota bacterium]
MLVGFGTADITPPLGTPLAGHFRRRPAQGIHDPLLATAVVFEHADTRLAVASCDLLGLTEEVSNAARELIHQQVGIDPKAVLLAATHTHAGPELRPERGAADRSYLELLVEKIATAVVLAARSLQPAELLAAVGKETRISFNRRYRMRDGTVKTNPGVGNPDIIEPAGPIDPDVLAVWAMADGRPIGLLLNFACHLDVLGSANQLVSADVPCYVRRVLAGATGGNVPVVYLNGTCGDINHIDVSRGPLGGFEHSERMGQVLAGEALRLLQDAVPLSDGPLAAASRTLTVLRRQFDETVVRWAENTAADPSVPEDSWAYHRSRRILDAVQRSHEPGRAEICALRIGSLGLVGLPGEIFCEIGLAIKRRSPAQFTGVAELALHNLGYVPTRRAFDEGGYEVESAIWQENLDELLIGCASDLLAGVFAE